MSNFGSFTAKFTVLSGAPAKPDFKASDLNLVPNTPPQPTRSIQAFENLTQPLPRHFNFFFNPGLPSGKHELEGGKNETAFFNEDRYGYETVKSLIKIDIDSSSGTYIGTFHIEMLDRSLRTVIADGEFDIKVIPK